VTRDPRRDPAQCRLLAAETSGECRVEVFFVMAPPSQRLEPTANPGQFTMRTRRSGTMQHSGSLCERAGSAPIRKP
jgi:hypothetical protein